MQPIGRIVMQVLWPAFLMAIVAEGVFFSMIDPRDLPVVITHLGDSREAAYTVAFFAFWALAACSSAVTFLLGQRAPGTFAVDDEAAARAQRAAR